MTVMTSPGTGSDHSAGPNAPAPARRRTPRVAVPGRFTAVWFGATLLLSVLMLRIQAATDVISMDVLSIVMLAPALAMAVAWLITGRPAFLITPAIRPRSFLGLLTIGVAFGLLCWVGMAITTGRVGHLPAQVAGVPLPLMVLAQLLGAVGEEIGYKGVLYSYLSRRFRLPLAMTIQGVIFGVIHLQYWSGGVGVVLPFFIGAIGLVAAIPVVWRGSFVQRVVVAAVMHCAVNLIGFGFYGDAPLQMVPFAICVWSGTLPLLVGWLVIRHRRAATGRVSLFRRGTAL